VARVEPPRPAPRTLRRRSGLDGTVADGKDFLEGRFVSLFDPELRIVRRASTAPGSRAFLLDLDAAA
jgi:hypothetical protein